MCWQTFHPRYSRRIETEIELKLKLKLNSKEKLGGLDQGKTLAKKMID